MLEVFYLMQMCIFFFYLTTPIHIFRMKQKVLEFVLVWMH